MHPSHLLALTGSALAVAYVAAIAGAVVVVLGGLRWRWPAHFANLLTLLFFPPAAFFCAQATIVAESTSAVLLAAAGAFLFASGVRRIRLARRLGEDGPDHQFQMFDLLVFATALAIPLGMRAVLLR
ncbi:MAG: hypothetical protein CMJ58_00690 [Planctomycetaceae bacterium]|nr:hypothetical protein [Planctomycetaceae bacterium]